jgi:hypothetical protein
MGHGRQTPPSLMSRPSFALLGAPDGALAVAVVEVGASIELVGRTSSKEAIVAATAVQLAAAGPFVQQIVAGLAVASVLAGTHAADVVARAAPLVRRFPRPRALRARAVIRPRSPAALGAGRQNGSGS